MEQDTGSLLVLASVLYCIRTYRTVEGQGQEKLGFGGSETE